MSIEKNQISKQAVPAGQRLKPVASVRPELRSGTTYPLMVAIIESKGGVGKSITAQCLYEVLCLFNGTENRVHVVETDTSNSSMKAVGLATGATIDTRDDTFQGGLLEIAHLLKMRSFDHAVLDSGARDEPLILPILPRLAQLMRDAGGALVMVRPITTSHFVFSNAARAAIRFAKDPIAVILTENWSQGRRPTDFDYWHSTTLHGQALSAGAVETHLDSFGVVIADNAANFRLSLRDIANRNFAPAGQLAEVAGGMFTLRHSLKVAEVLDDIVTRMPTVIAQALDKKGLRR